MMALSVDARGVLVPCLSCGQTNRLAYDRLGLSVRCGKCHVDLPAPDRPVDVSRTADFDALVRASRVPVLVDFWAAWCGPCRMVAPEMERVAAAHAGEWLVAKVDTEAVPDLAARLQIQSIPTMAVFRNGVLADRTSGAMPAAQIAAFVQNALSSSAR